MNASPSDPDDVPFDDPPQDGANGSHESFEVALPAQRRPAPAGGPVLTPEESQAAIRSGLQAIGTAPQPNGRHPPVIPMGRVLPHSLEAEQYVLASCMLDGPDVIPRCREGHVTPASMFSPANATLLSVILDLADHRRPTEIDTVAEELRSRCLLDQVGGMSYLVQVTSTIPTTALVDFFIGKVRDLAARRAIITEGTRAVEEAFTGSSTVTELVAIHHDRMQGIMQRAEQQSVLQELAGRRGGVGVPVHDEGPVLWLRDTAIAHRSNLGLITALQKHGKSAVCGAILGSVMADPDHRKDTLGFRADNPHGHAVLHLDTEQSAKDHESLLQTALQRAGTSQIPDWLHSYRMKGIGADTLRLTLGRLLRDLARRHQRILFVILDGVAEFVIDPNDPRECNPFVTQLESFATDYDCSIMSVLHLNPAPQNQPTKSRGHLGSQLERKCETDLRLVKDTHGTSTIFTSSARHAPIFEKDGLRFSWDKDAQMHLTCAGPPPRDSLRADSLQELAGEVFGTAGSNRLRYSDFLRALERVGNIGTKRAESRFSEMKRAGLLVKDAMGFWSAKVPSE